MQNSEYREVPWEAPSISSEDFDELQKLWPYSKKTATELITRFESDLAAFTRTDHVITVNNGSSALVCALLANGLKPGDRVAVPTYTFASVVNSILLARAVPVLIDSDPETFNMDLSSLEKEVKSREIKCLIHVDVAGQPPDLNALSDFCKDKKIRLIEDGAEALGTAYRKKMIGGFCHTTTLSFHPAKQLTTIEGGAVLTNDQSIAKRLSVIRNHGMSSTYEHIDMGFNFRLAPFEAAFGISQLRKINQFIERRVAIANHYILSLSNTVQFQKIMPYVTKFSWGAFLILINSKSRRDELLHYLALKGIEARVMWKPIHLQPYHRSFVSGRFPFAEDIFNRVISLPIGNGMSLDSADYVAESVKTFLQQS